MNFRCRIPVRFGDIDPAEIAYYPTLFDRCYAAFEGFLEVALTVAHLGRAPVIFRCRASVRSRPAFEVLGTTACVDVRTFKTKPVPERSRKPLARHLATPAPRRL